MDFDRQLMAALLREAAALLEAGTPPAQLARMTGIIARRMEKSA